MINGRRLVRPERFFEPEFIAAANQPYETARPAGHPY
jgi:hypothetical protein